MMSENEDIWYGDQDGDRPQWDVRGRLFQKIVRSKFALTLFLILLVGIIFVTSTVSDNSNKLIRPELYPTTTDSPNESITIAELGGPFEALKDQSNAT